MIRADTGVSLDSRWRGNERRSKNLDLIALDDLDGADHLGVDAAVGAAERLHQRLRDGEVVECAPVWDNSEDQVWDNA